MAINNFNRIINLTFYRSKTGTAVGKKIITPTKGRKPSIEINGNFTTASYLPAFNITIKNMYLDLFTDQYTRIKVEAGYENNIVSFHGTIRTIYRESPGPEGTTVIQYQQGEMDSWLSTFVNIDKEKGTRLEEVLREINLALGLNEVEMDPTLRFLTLKNKFTVQKSAKDALYQLRCEFPDEKLVIMQMENKLKVFSLKKGSAGRVAKPIRFLSTPPQQNPGDDDGAFYTTFCAPWMPDLNIGDTASIPTRQYLKNFSLVGNKDKNNIIVVTAIQFQFSTTGGANTMTVQGYGV